MRSVRAAASAAVLGGLLAVAAAAPAFAQDQGSDSLDVARGEEAGNIDYNDTPQAPDTGTSVAVGGDSNLGVPQPELSRVPTTGDGIFSLDVEPSGVTMTTTAAPAGSAPPAAAPAEAAPVESAPVEGEATAAPVEGEAAAAPAAGEAPPVPTCADYPSWYDAQIALEAAADAALAASLDPDGNGIACEDVAS
jgi:hypothetical protein